MTGPLSPEVRESFQEKHATVAEWRRQVLGDLVWRFTPYNEATTIEDVARQAVAYYENGGREKIVSGDPMFERYPDSFVTEDRIISQSAKIRKTLAREGRFIQIVPFKGIKKAETRKDVEEALSGESNAIQGQVESYNEMVEEARRHKKANVLSFNVQLLPAGEKS